MPLSRTEFAAAAFVPVCIRLPFLRGSLPPELDEAQDRMPPVPRALRLWPGHTPPGGAVPDGWYAPDGYPFGEGEAAACLAAFGALDARDLAGARDAADRAQAGRRARELGELADLAVFAAHPDAVGPQGRAAPDRLARVAAEQAQKLLLWLWLQEERLTELAALAAGCARGLRRLAAEFGEGRSGAPDGAQAEEAPFPLHPGLVPPWRPAAAGADLFAPAGTAFFVEGPMRGELLAALDFRPAPEWGARLGCRPEDAGRLVAAEAPLWRALGRRQPEGGAQARVWLTWGRP